MECGGVRQYRVPRFKKINLGKVKECLGTVCPKCGRVIEPAEIQRVNFEEIACPDCGSRFQAGKGKPEGKSCQ
jgi:DNA-directed RNA polymerase subunit RPC12/RpoP